MSALQLYIPSLGFNVETTFKLKREYTSKPVLVDK